MKPARQKSKRSHKELAEDGEVDNALTDEEDWDNNGPTATKRHRVTRTKSSSKVGGRTHDDIAQELNAEIEEAMQNIDDDDEYINEQIKEDEQNDSEAGQILKIEVENFMCHKRFSISLGKGLNFVTGKNGSGKSAIVAAIQLCLGATARNTGRGSSMSGLVREGSNDHAIARITLRNTGVDAYRSDAYGDKIIVERKISRAGQSDYCIYSHDKKKISGQKSELEKILRSFNILVDNPCCILTQDESKKFIQGKDDDKYQFFLKATGLHNLKEQYIEDIKNLDDAEKNQISQEEKLIKKREAVQELKEKLDKLVRLDKIQEDIKYFQVKLKWIDIRDSENQLREINQSIQQLERAVQKAKKDLNNASNNDQEQAEQIDALTQELNVEVQKIDQSVAEITSIQKEVVQSDQQLQIQRSQLNSKIRAKKELQERLTIVQRDINQLRAKAMQSASVEEKKYLDELEQIKSDMDRLHQDEQNVKQEKQQVNTQFQQLRSEDEQLRNQRGHIHNSIKKIENDLRNLDGSSNNKFSRFGREFVQLMQLVGNTQFEGTVLGPIAAHVTIKESCERFELAIERCLGGVFRSFIVTTDNDRQRLNELMNRCNLRGKVNIIQQPTYRGRYEIRHAAKENEDVITVEKAINVDHDLVYNVLIDYAHIEMTALIQKELVDLHTVMNISAHGDQFKYNISAAIDTTGTLITCKGGNRSSEQSKANNPSNHFSQDTTQYKTNLQKSLQEKQAELQALQNTYEHVTTQLKQVDQNQKALQRQTEQITNQLRQLYRQKQQCESKINDISEANKIDTTPLESEVEELQQQLASEEAAIEGIKLEVSQIEVSHKQKLDEKKRADGARARLKQTTNEIQKRIEDIVQQQVQAKKISNNLEKQVQDREKALSTEQGKRDQLLEKKKELLQVAIEYTLKIYPNWNTTMTKQTSRSNNSKANKNQESPSDYFMESDDGDNDHMISRSSANAVVDDENHQDGEDDEMERFRRPELGNKETKQSIDREIQKMRADYEQTMRVAGMAGQTVDQLRKSYNDANKQLEEAEETLSTLKQNIIDTRADTVLRKARWKQELVTSTKLTKKKFDQYVQEKGSAGTIKFDHKAGKLELSFQVDSADQTSIRNDVRNLSGGERSFVTFSLLLALGHVIESPFRLMDEYDVYLDEPSRKLTLDQLQRYTRQAKQRNRQFIILTPHTLGDVCTGPFVRIHHMPDPDRKSAHGLQQQVLNFGDEDD